jgi:hypothetical protein
MNSGAGLRNLLLHWLVVIIQKQGCQIIYLHRYQKSQLGTILEGLGIENNITFHGKFGIFYGLLAHFMAFRYILWWFDIFFPLGYVAPRKIWQPCTEMDRAQVSIYIFGLTGYLKYLADVRILEKQSYFDLDLPVRKQRTN